MRTSAASAAVDYVFGTSNGRSHSMPIRNLREATFQKSVVHDLNVGRLRGGGVIAEADVMDTEQCLQCQAVDLLNYT